MGMCFVLLLFIYAPSRFRHQYFFVLGWLGIDKEGEEQYIAGRPEAIVEVYSWVVVFLVLVDFGFEMWARWVALISWLLRGGWTMNRGIWCLSRKFCLLRRIGIIRRNEEHCRTTVWYAVDLQLRSG